MVKRPIYAHFTEYASVGNLCELDGRNIPALISAFEEREAGVFSTISYAISSLNSLLRTFDARNQLCRFQILAFFENALKRFRK